MTGQRRGGDEALRDAVVVVVLCIGIGCSESPASLSTNVDS